VATARSRGGDPLQEDHRRPFRGEILLLKDTLKYHGRAASLVRRRSDARWRRRGSATEGRLGGQAVVPGVGGTWKDLTDNVNLLAANLTTQVRNIAEVTTPRWRAATCRARITVDVKGEILETEKTPSTRWWTSSTRSPAKVTRVGARGSAPRASSADRRRWPGRVAGTWKDLTDNRELHGGQPD